MSDLEAFIQSLPKAELHIHIEGSLEPEMMLALAKRNNVSLPFQSIEEIHDAYNFHNLQEFLDLYYQGMSVLQTKQDFEDLTFAYLKRVAADNCQHVEVFFDPQGHTERGIPFDDVIEGIFNGLRKGEDELNISSHLILSFLRHLSEESAFETLVLAEPYLDRLLGVGLDSSEVGHPPSKFKNVFKAAKEKGLKLFAHAGEEGPPAYVWEAIDILAIDRIDHGNRSLEDKALIDYIIHKDLYLTVCPLSNLKLCVVDRLEAHPLKEMLSLGLRATINSDDPSYFGGYLHANYVEIANALQLSQHDLAQLATNSIDGSYMAPEKKVVLRQQIKDLL